MTQKSHKSESHDEGKNDEVQAQGSAPVSGSSILADLRDLESAVTAGDWQKADQAAINLHQKGHNLVWGASGMGAGSVTQDVDKSEVTTCCDKIAAKCSTTMAKSASPTGEVGKIGDGKIAELIMKLLPIILSLFA